MFTACCPDRASGNCSQAAAAHSTQAEPASLLCREHDYEDPAGYQMPGDHPRRLTSVPHSDRMTQNPVRTRVGCSSAPYAVVSTIAGRRCVPLSTLCVPALDSAAVLVMGQ